MKELKEIPMDQKHRDDMSISSQKVFLMAGFLFCSKENVHYIRFLFVSMMQI